MKYILLAIMGVLGLFQSQNALAALQKMQEMNNTPMRPAIKPIIPNGKLIGYLPGWKKPPAAADLAQAGYTHIVVAFAVFNTLNPGELTPAFHTVSKEYIEQLQAYGIKVLLSIGGPSTEIPHTSVHYHAMVKKSPSPQLFQKKFLASLEHFLNKYNFDGVDFDIEQDFTASGSLTHPTGDIRILADVIHTLHLKYPNRLISLAPQVENVSASTLFNAMWSNYAALIMQVHDDLSWVGIQLYNSGCAYSLNKICYEPNPSNIPDFYVVVVSDLLENWPKTLKNGEETDFQPYISYLKPSQVVLGFFVPSPKRKLATVPFATIKRALNCLNTGKVSNNACAAYTPPKAYQHIGGVFGWEVTYDEENDFKFAANIRECAIHYVCAGQ